jgi:hypothetical protein
MKYKRVVSVSCIICSMTIGAELPKMEIDDPRIWDEMQRHYDLIRRHMKEQHKSITTNDKGEMSINLDNYEDDVVDQRNNYRFSQQ